MSKSTINPVTSAERVETLDALRGLAVGGILIGNMQWFSGYGMMPPALAEQMPLVDRATHFFVHFFIEGKFYSIFPFLFGFGFALQIARADRDDANGLFCGSNAGKPPATHNYEFLFAAIDNVPDGRLQAACEMLIR